MMRRRELLAIFGGAGTAATLPVVSSAFEVHTSERASFLVVEVASGLAKPWGMAFLPSREVLVTELKAGRLCAISNGRLEEQAITGVPPEAADRGLIDVAIHPRFAENGLLFLTYIGGTKNSRALYLARTVLQDRHLSDWTVIFRAEPHTADRGHPGNRILVDGSGHVFVSVGDRNEPERAQRVDDLAGKISRIRDDGSVPDDNPFVSTPGARPEIWTLGHRNPQGLAFRPGANQLWASEHGPLGGDELNLIEPGRNYGWPRATFGTDRDGSPIGDGPLQPGLTPPVHYWDALTLQPPASVAPAGIDFCDGSRFPGWKGNLFVACLRGQMLIRLELDAVGKVTHEERLLTGILGRLRHVRQGPDGLLYLLTDDKDRGQVLRLEPA
jgi:glucose/arabinose dehydrogenase